MDNIIASQGAQLTDDELQQLAGIVKIQIRQRSSLSQGDLVLDKGQAVYQRITGSWDNRKYTNVNDVEAIDLFRKGTGSGVYVTKSGGRQDKFIRMAVRRLRHVIEPLELMQKMFSSAVIDLPIAKEVIESIEDEIAKVRTVFEVKAEKLSKMIEKKNTKTKKLKAGV